MPPPPRSELNRMHAQLCTAVAEPVRIAILYALSDGPKYVGEIQHMLDLPQSTISRHLAILRTTGLVRDERKGRKVRYYLKDTRVIDALEILRSIMADLVKAQAQTLDAREKT